MKHLDAEVIRADTMTMLQTDTHTFLTTKSKSGQDWELFGNVFVCPVVEDTDYRYGQMIVRTK